MEINCNHLPYLLLPHLAEVSKIADYSQDAKTRGGGFQESQDRQQNPI